VANNPASPQGGKGSRIRTTPDMGNQGANLPGISVSAPDSIDMHTIGDWEIEQFLACSRGKLADWMFLFWGGCLGSFITTAKYVYDYVAAADHALGIVVFLQTILFFMCLALAIAFTILNRKRTVKAEELAVQIRSRGKVTYRRST